MTNLKFRKATIQRNVLARCHGVGHEVLRIGLEGKVVSEGMFNWFGARMYEFRTPKERLALGEKPYDIIFFIPEWAVKVGEEVT